MAIACQIEIFPKAPINVHLYSTITMAGDLGVITLKNMIVKPSINMYSGPVKLIFVKIVDVEPGGELVLFYHFKIIN